MARKITTESVAAFLNGERFNKANMTVTCEDGETRMYLHGNLIARAFTVPGGFGVMDSDQIEITDAGWQTVTTKERLNGLLSAFAPGCGIYQRNHVWYIDVADVRGDLEWNGRATFTRGGTWLC